MKLSEFLTKDRWCQRHYALDSNGHVTNCYSDDAQRFCLVGALSHVFPDWEVRRDIGKKIQDVLGPSRDMTVYNDSHTWEDVHNLLLEADV